MANEFNAKNIIVGAGSVYLGVNTGVEYDEDTIFAASGTTGASVALTGAVAKPTAQLPGSVNADNWQSVGYTSEGVDLSFEPEYGEVQVDQLLDVARIFKQGQRVMLNTSFTEGTLENLLIAIGGKSTDLGTTTSGVRAMDINGGALGYTPIERSILVVGPAPEELIVDPVTGLPQANKAAERIYIGYRALSMDTVGVGIKRDSATVFPVSFRLLPSSDEVAADGNATYGKVIDRVYTV
jgi:hypothetical protein